MNSTRPAAPFVIGLGARFGSLFGVGVLLRLWAFLARGALWNDEAGLALNVVGRSFSQVARPFVYQQYAPYLYVVGSKVVADVLGPSERALRLWSFIAGCLLLPAMLWLARQVSGWAAALFALALLVPNPMLVRYATEFKPYQGDALVACVLCALTVHVLQHPAKQPRALIAIALAGVIAPWLSLPSIFVLAAAAAALLVDGVARGGPARSAYVALTLGALWLASFAAHYLLFMQMPPADAAYMQDYWTRQNAFAPFPPRSAADFHFYPAKFFFMFDVFVAPGGFGLRYVAGALWAFGMFTLYRKQRPVFVLFATPFVLLLIAAAAHKYLVADRLLLFLVPMLVTPVVLALAELAELRGQVTQLTAAAVAVMFCAGPSLLVARELSSPAPKSSIDQLVAHLRDHYRLGDRLYVEKQAEFIFSFYARRSHFDAPFPIPDDHLYEAHPTYSTLDTLRGASRVWVVVPALAGERPKNDEATRLVSRAETLVTTHLNGFGRVVDVLDGGSSRLYLYDLQKPP